MNDIENAKRRHTLLLLGFMTALAVVILGAMILGIYGVYKSSMKPHANENEIIPSGMQQFKEMRADVVGKKVNDIDRIELKVPWQNEQLVVRDSHALTMMLRGMQEALETKERFGNLGATVTVYWKDGGGHTKTFGFCSQGDWRYAFSPWFIIGVNEVVPKEYRIPMK